MILVSRRKYNELKMRTGAKIDRLISENQRLNSELASQKDKNFKLLTDKSAKEDSYILQIKEISNSYQTKIFFLEKRLENKDSEIGNLKQKLRLSNSAKGGLQRSLNYLKNKNKELKTTSKIIKVRPCKGTIQKMKAPKTQINSVRRELKEIDNVRRNS